MRSVASLWPRALPPQRAAALLFLLMLGIAIAESQQPPPRSPQPPPRSPQPQQQQQQFREYPRPPSPSSAAGWREPSAGSRQTSGEWRPQGSGQAPQRSGVQQPPSGGPSGPLRPAGSPADQARPGSPGPQPQRPGAGPLQPPRQPQAISGERRPPQPTSGERRPPPPAYPGGPGPVAPAGVAGDTRPAAVGPAQMYTGKAYPGPTPVPPAQQGTGPNVTRPVRVVCYYTNWAQKRAYPSMFYPEDIDPNMCTHINFAFARVSQHSLQPTTWNDIDMYARIQNLKLKNPSLKILLSVGGWNHGTKNFTEAAFTPSSRATFVQNVLAYLRQYGFDGLDLVWMYPGAGNSPPEDKKRFTFLVQELRDAFDHESSLSGKTGFLLTAAVSTNEIVVNRAYEIDRLAECLDWVNLMTYDMRTANQTLFAQPHSSLYGPPGDPFTVDYAVRMWIANGMPPRKVVIGVPMYGRSFRLAAAANHDVNANAVGAGDVGWYTISPGFLSYFEICQDHDFLRNEMFDMLRRVPYSWNRKLDWIGYESPRSMTEKCHFVQGAGIGGVMVWTLDLDDFSGTFCNAGKYPLLRELSSCLIMSLGSRYQQTGRQATAGESGQSMPQAHGAVGSAGGAAGSQAQQPLQLQPLQLQPASPGAVRPQSPFKPLGAESAGVPQALQRPDQLSAGGVPQSALGIGQPLTQQQSAGSFRPGEGGLLQMMQHTLQQPAIDVQRQPAAAHLPQLTKPLWKEKEGEKVIGAAKLSAAVLIQEGDNKAIDESQAYGKHHGGGKKPLLSVLEAIGGKDTVAIACTEVFICPSSASVGDLYADPCDCTKFYECNDSVAVRRSCPKLWAWESSSKRCKHHKEVTSCHADFTL